MKIVQNNSLNYTLFIRNYTTHERFGLDKTIVRVVVSYSHTIDGVVDRSPHHYGVLETQEADDSSTHHHSKVDRQGGQDRKYVRFNVRYGGGHL